VVRLRARRRSGLDLGVGVALRYETCQGGDDAYGFDHHWSGAHRGRPDRVPGATKAGVAPEGAGGELAEVLKELNALLEKFDKRFRPGLILMLVGLALVGAGIYWETVDAKNAAKKATAPAALVRPPSG
jgi:hypothetical protein